MDKIEAIKATRNGAIAALISATLTIVVIAIAISTDTEGKLAIFNDPANFIDVVLILICAAGMYKKSRVASVLIFVYFTASKIIIAIETQTYSGFGISIIFLYFYGKAIQGSFLYHKFEKEENPDYKATTKLTYIIGIPSLLVIVAFIGFALMSTIGVIPSTRVQSGNEINADDIAILNSQEIITPKDDIKYFYSHGLSSILESGNVLTQDRVILYINSENEGMEIYEIFLNEITEVVLETEGDTLNDSVYRINTNDPERWLKLFLSTEQKGDERFIKALHDNLSI